MTQTPHPVSGIITDSNGSTPEGTVVIIFNIRTNGKITGTTNSSGEYTLDLANSSEAEYADGDEILIRALINGEHIRMQEIRKTISTSTGFLNQDLTLFGAQPKQDLETLNSHDVSIREHDSRFRAKRLIIVAPTANGEVVPIMSELDSTGKYGKLSVN